MEAISEYTRGICNGCGRLRRVRLYVIIGETWVSLQKNQWLCRECKRDKEKKDEEPHSM